MAKLYKTKYSGVYKNKVNNHFYYLSKIKLQDGTFKSVRSKAIYQTAIQCYTDLIKLKESQQPSEKEFKDAIPVPTKNTAPKQFLKPFKDVVEEWLETQKSKYKETTYYQKKSTCNSLLLQIYKDHSINSVCETKSLVEFTNYLSTLEISNARRNQIIATFKSICEYAYYSSYISQKEYGLTQLNLIPFKSISETAKPKRKQKEKFFYTIKEFNFFVSIMENDVELKMILYMLFYGGFRIGELFALLKEDIEFTLGFAKVYKTYHHFSKEMSTTKTANSVRRVYLPPMVLTMLQEYVQDMKPNERIFKMPHTTLTNKLKLYSKALKVPYLNPHGYRHSCCSYFFQRYKDKNIAIDFKQVADHLGDRVDTILDVYYHIYGDEKSKLVYLVED